MTLVGAVELGGTKIRVGRGTPDVRILDSDTFPTTGPEESLARVRAYFEDGPAVSALGIGSFGPVVIRPGAPDYGEMRATPKQGWSGFNVVRALGALNVPVALETDVAAAGLGEYRQGALKDVGCGLYLTLGTGIGGALILNGRVVNGATHAEMGHLPIPRAPSDTFPSNCPYHPSCAEGLASGPAILKRFGYLLSDQRCTPDQLALIGGYLGQFIGSLVLAFAPQRIVVGGGVAKTPMLLKAAHEAALASLNGYLSYPELLEPGFLTPPSLGDDAGLVGGLCLAREAAGLT